MNTPQSSLPPPHDPHLWNEHCAQENMINTPTQILGGAISFPSFRGLPWPPRERGIFLKLGVNSENSETWVGPLVFRNFGMYLGPRRRSSHNHRPPTKNLQNSRDALTPQIQQICGSELPSHTPGFLIHEFWAGRKSSISGVWGAPGASKPIQNYAGRSPPYF